MNGSASSDELRKFQETPDYAFLRIEGGEFFTEYCDRALMGKQVTMQEDAPNKWYTMATKAYSEDPALYKNECGGTDFMFASGPYDKTMRIYIPQSRPKLRDEFANSGWKLTTLPDLDGASTNGTPEVYLAEFGGRSWFVMRKMRNEAGRCAE